MPIGYKTDHSQGGHLRKRSSASTPPTPLVAHMFYDDNTGRISLPPSPPLLSWREKDPTALGLYYADEKKGKLPPYSWPKARGNVMGRPWLSVVGLGCGTFFFVLILFYFNPVTPYKVSLLSRIPFRATACEPYSAFGSLTVDASNPDRNQWVPFDASCKPPSFMAKLRSDHPSGTDFSWLHNRTALIIGDSISREQVEGFCQLMGYESEVIRKYHKYAPSPSTVRAPVKAGHEVEKPARLGARGYRVVRDASLPRVCYIPEYDFMLVSVFHFGLDQEDYWRGSRMPQYAAPGLFEHRLSDVVEPLISNLRADGRKTAPDFVEVSSGTWDLARWAEQDIADKKDPETGLSQDRVTWYRFRVGQMLERVRKAFPDAKAKTWRTMHYPLDQASEHDYFMDKISPSRRDASAEATPAYFAHNRIYQLDQVTRSLINPVITNGVASPAPHSDFRLNEWGPILKGHDAHQKDRLHGDSLPGGYVWSDIMLYELWKGVRTSESQPMRKLSPFN